MNLEWLLALLCPEDFAPHPNFRDPEHDSRPWAILAGIVHPDVDWRSISEQRYRDSEHLKTGIDRRIIEAVRMSFIAESQLDAISEAQQLLLLPGVDVAARVVVGLVAAVAAAELDQEQVCLSILDGLVDDVIAPVEGSNRSLLLACVLQQKALRLRDFGGYNWGQTCAEAAQALRDIDLVDVHAAVSRPKAARKGQAVIEDVVACLKDASARLSSPLMSFTANSDPRLFSLSDVSLTERANHFHYVSTSESGEFIRFADDIFQREFKSSSITLGRSVPDIFFTALQYELYGSGAVYVVRRELALLRLVQHGDFISEAVYSDALGLLRSANADKDLRLVLRRVREKGPLLALSADVRRVIATRSAPPQFREVDLLVLRSGVGLLSVPEASHALDGVLQHIEQGSPLNVPGKLSHSAVRLELPLLCACGLANRTERGEEVSALLLEIIGGAKLDDELLDRVIGKAISLLDWARVPESNRILWKAIQPTLGSGLNQSLNSLREAGVLHQTDGFEPSDVSSITDVVRFVSARQRDMKSGAFDYSTDVAVAEAAAGVVIEALTHERSRASQHVFAGGGYDSALIGAYLLEMGSVDIWPHIIDYICDSNIGRDSCADLLDKMAFGQMAPPYDSLLKLRDNSRVILYKSGRGMFFDSAPSEPFASAVRYFAVVNIIDEFESCSLVNELAANRNGRSRTEAAKTVQFLGARFEWDWLPGLAVQLSYDDDFETRGIAGAALAAYSGPTSSSAYREIATAEVIRLLNSDGIVAPMYVLTRFLETPGLLCEDVRDVVARLADMHPSNEVRSAATNLLNSRE